MSLNLDCGDERTSAGEDLDVLNSEFFLDVYARAKLGLEINGCVGIRQDSVPVDVCKC